MNRLFVIQFAVCLVFICIASQAALVNAHRKKADFSALADACKAGDAAAVNQLLVEGAPVNGQKGDDWSLLMWAVFHGHTNLVQRLLGAGADVNYTDHIRQTPFILAIREGKRSIASLLLDHGAKIDAQDGNGWTPLMHAANEGHLDLLNWLLEMGANPTLRTRQRLVQSSPTSGFMTLSARQYTDDRSVLHIASFAGHEDIVRRILELRPDVNQTADDGTVPLLEACRSGSLATAKRLIEHGALVNLSNFSGETALHWASFMGNAELVALLIQKAANVNAQLSSSDFSRRYELQTPLHWAVLSGNYQTVRTLIEAGSEPNAADYRGRTPFYLAIKNGYDDIGRLLEAHGADVNASDSYSGTPLIAATRKGDREVALRLLKHGANQAAHGNSKVSLLMAAAQGGWIEMMRGLVERGARVDARDRFGRTPLLFALENNQPEAARWLLKHGASPFARDKEGSTALMYACTWDSESVTDIVQYQQIASHGKYLDVAELDSKGFTALMYCAKYRNEEGVERLIALMTAAARNYINSNEGSALSLAVKYGTPGIVKMLLDSGVNPNVSVPWGPSVLFFALHRGKTEVADMLKAAGARIKIVPKERKLETDIIDAICDNTSDRLAKLLANGLSPNWTSSTESVYDDVPQKTVLHIAAGCGADESIRLLISAGADVNETNTYGLTPLHLAAANGKIEALRILLEKGANPNRTGSYWYEEPAFFEAYRSDPISPFDAAYSNDQLAVGSLLVAHGAKLPAGPRRRLEMLTALSSKKDPISWYELFQSEGVDTRCLFRKLHFYDAKEENGNSINPLTEAVKERRLVLARRLIADGALVDAPDDMGQTALMLAAGWGLTELVRALIDKGAKVNQLSHSGNYLHQGCESALYFAAQWDHCETVKLLLDSGANPNLENAASALSAAVRFHQRCSVSALLDAGAIVDDKDKQEAKEEGFTEMLKMLEAAR